MKNLNYIAFVLVGVLFLSSVQAIQLGGAGHRNVTDTEWDWSDDYIYLGLNKGQRKKVGVGTETPEKDFEVEGDAQFTDVYIKNDIPRLTLDRSGVVAGIMSADGSSLDIVAGSGYDLRFGSNNIYDRLLLDMNGNVGIGVSSVSAGLRLDIGGRVGASEYCDENGGNCKSITEMGAGGNSGEVVVSGAGGDCGLSAVFVAERGSISSNSTWSLGNGQSPDGTPMGCDGYVSKVAAMCSGNIGRSLDAYLYKNGSKTSCKVDLSTKKGEAVIGDCDEKFVGTDVLNIGAGSESGSWSVCVGTFWVKYDVVVEDTSTSNNGNGNGRWR